MKLPPDLSTEALFPAFSATNRMMNHMDIAAARLLKPRLNDGEASVAVAMNVTYVSPNLRRASAADSMRAVATYIGITGRLHRFTINAFDDSGLVGTAEHTRAVIVERRLSGDAGHRAGRHGQLLTA